MSEELAPMRHDLFYGDVCISLDIKNREEIKHKNARADKLKEFEWNQLDRSEQITLRAHDHEIRTIRENLPRLYTKTPYFETFLAVNAHPAVKRNEYRASVRSVEVPRERKKEAKDDRQTKSVNQHDSLARQLTLRKENSTCPQMLLPQRRAKESSELSWKSHTSAGSERVESKSPVVRDAEPKKVKGHLERARGGFDEQRRGSLPPLPVGFTEQRRDRFMAGKSRRREATVLTVQNLAAHDREQGEATRTVIDEESDGVVFITQTARRARERIASA